MHGRDRELASNARSLAKLATTSRNILSLDKDAVQVLKDFEVGLQKYSIISSSFKEIVDSNLNQRQRKKQVVIIYLFFITIAIYALQCLLHLFPKDTRKFYQFIPDVHGQLGVVGQIITFGLGTFMTNAAADKIVMRRSEKQNNLEFLTDLRTLIEGHGYFGLNNEEITRLVSKLKKKIIFCQLNIPSSYLNAYGILTTALVIFLYKTDPTFVTACLAVFFSIMSGVITKLSVEHFFATYLSYIIMTDCLTARFQSIIVKLDKIEERELIDKRQLQRLLDEIEYLLITVHKYSWTMRPLLRNMIAYFRTGLCSIFLLYVLSMNIEFLLRVLIFIPVSLVTFVVILSSLYISGTKAQLFDLSRALNNRYVKTISVSSLKLQIQARLLLKELGSNCKDGHFVVGFADGSGPAMTSEEITKLTLDTVFNSMMFLSMINI